MMRVGILQRTAYYSSRNGILVRRNYSLERSMYKTNYPVLTIQSRNIRDEPSENKKPKRKKLRKIQDITTNFSPIKPNESEERKNQRKEVWERAKEDILLEHDPVFADRFNNDLIDESIVKKAIANNSNPNIHDSGATIKEMEEQLSSINVLTVYEDFNRRQEEQGNYGGNINSIRSSLNPDEQSMGFGGNNDNISKSDIFKGKDNQFNSRAHTAYQLKNPLSQQAQLLDEQYQQLARILYEKTNDPKMIDAIRSKQKTSTKFNLDKILDHNEQKKRGREAFELNDLTDEQKDEMKQKEEEMLNTNINFADYPDYTYEALPNYDNENEEFKDGIESLTHNLKNKYITRKNIGDDKTVHELRNQEVKRIYGDNAPQKLYLGEIQEKNEKHYVGVDNGEDTDQDFASGTRYLDNVEESYSDESVEEYGNKSEEDDDLQSALPKERLYGLSEYGNIGERRITKIEHPQLINKHKNDPTNEIINSKMFENLEDEKNNNYTVKEIFGNLFEHLSIEKSRTLSESLLYSTMNHFKNEDAHQFVKAILQLRNASAVNNLENLENSSLAYKMYEQFQILRDGEDPIDLAETADTIVRLTPNNITCVVELLKVNKKKNSISFFEEDSNLMVKPSFETTLGASILDRDIPLFLKNTSFDSKLLSSYENSNYEKSPFMGDINATSIQSGFSDNYGNPDNATKAHINLLHESSKTQSFTYEDAKSELFENETGGVNHHDTLSFLNNIEVQSIPIDKSNYYPTIDGKDEIFEMIGDNTDGDETDEVDDKTENKLVDQLAQVFKKDGYQNKEDSDDPLLNSRIKERAKEIINNITPDIPIDFPKPEELAIQHVINKGGSTNDIKDAITRYLLNGETNSLVADEHPYFNGNSKTDDSITSGPEFLKLLHESCNNSSPEPEIYNAGIINYVRSEHLRDAMYLVDDMKKHNIIPSEDSYAAIVEGFYSNFDITGGDAFAIEMKQNYPNSTPPSADLVTEGSYLKATDF